MNYFELFEIPITPEVNQVELNKKYLALQRKYHPDFFTNASEDEKSEALERSSLINEGLKTLKNPENTLQYVLQLKGLIEPEEKYRLPNDFLMEMMELNEELDEQSLTAIKAYETGLYKEVQPILQGYDDQKITAEELARLKEYYYKKKYLRRMVDRISG